MDEKLKKYREELDKKWESFLTKEEIEESRKRVSKLVESIENNDEPPVFPIVRRVYAPIFKNYDSPSS